MKTEKQTIIVDQATPKTQPAGVHGAWFKLVYQGDVGPLSINQVPMPKAPKLIVKKIRINGSNFIFSFTLILSNLLYGKSL